MLDVTRSPTVLVLLNDISMQLKVCRRTLMNMHSQAQPHRIQLANFKKKVVSMHKIYDTLQGRCPSTVIRKEMPEKITKKMYVSLLSIQRLAHVNIKLTSLRYRSVYH